MWRLHILIFLLLYKSSEHLFVDRHDSLARWECESVVKATTHVSGKGQKLRPPATLKPCNQSRQKLTWATTSWNSLGRLNFIALLSGVFAPQIRYWFSVPYGVTIDHRQGSPHWMHPTVAGGCSWDWCKSSEFLQGFGHANWKNMETEENSQRLLATQRFHFGAGGGKGLLPVTQSPWTSLRRSLPQIPLKAVASSSPCFHPNFFLPATPLILSKNAHLVATRLTWFKERWNAW